MNKYDGCEDFTAASQLNTDRFDDVRRETYHIPSQDSEDLMIAGDSPQDLQQIRYIVDRLRAGYIPLTAIRDYLNSGPPMQWYETRAQWLQGRLNEDPYLRPITIRIHRGRADHSTLNGRGPNAQPDEFAFEQGTYSSGRVFLRWVP